MSLPKAVLAWIAANPEKVEEYFSEQGEFFHGRGVREYWVYLNRYRNAVVDPLSPLHIVHERNGKEVLRQLRGIKPCGCESCQNNKT